MVNGLFSSRHCAASNEKCVWITHGWMSIAYAHADLVGVGTA